MQRGPKGAKRCNFERITEIARLGGLGIVRMDFRLVGRAVVQRRSLQLLRLPEGGSSPTTINRSPARPLLSRNVGRLHQLEIGGNVVLEELVEFRNAHRQLLDT